MALLSLTAGLAAGLAHLLTLLATLTPLPLPHGIELGETLALAIHCAGAVTLLHRAALAVGIALIHLTLAGTIDCHRATWTGASGTAEAAAGTHPRVVRVKDYIDGARRQGRAFSYDIVAQFVHLTFVLISFTLALDWSEKVSEVLVLVAHIPALIGEFLIGEVDAGKFFLKFFGVKFPSCLDRRGREDHRVG